MNDFEKTALRVSVINMTINALLAMAKVSVGLLSCSRAILSDGIHSAADAVSGVVLLIGLKLSARKADARHPYGYERLECVAAVILAIIVGAIGMLIGFQSVEDVLSVQPKEVPRLSTLWMPVAAIVMKETMFRYTRAAARRVHSTMLMADAWHQRTDALSSVGSCIGVIGMKCGLTYSDAVAGLVICVLIVKAAVEIFADAMQKMIDCSCDEKTQEALYAQAASCEGVIRVEALRTRLFGNRMYAEITVCVDAALSSSEAFEVVCSVRKRIMDAFDEVKECSVHIHPL